jgi:protein SCO1/2
MIARLALLIAPFLIVATRSRNDRRDVRTSYSNGRLSTERRYHGDREEGRHIGWYENGAVRFSYAYHDGVMEGVAREWLPDGTLYREAHYTRGQEEGLQRMWWPDGSLRASYVVKDGRRYGLLGAKGCVSTTLPFYIDRSLTPTWAVPDSAMHYVGDFALVDQNGRVTSRDDVRGKVYVASFFYTSCEQLCPKLRSQLSRVVDEFARDDSVIVLSHTIAPESDSVSVLRRYAKENHLDAKKWRLLTGSHAEIERLARDAYFVELRDSGGKTAGKLLHTETFVLVDAQGRIRGLYDGSLAYDVSQLIKDIHTLRIG